MHEKPSQTANSRLRRRRRHYSAVEMALSIRFDFILLPSLAHLAGPRRRAGWRMGQRMRLTTTGA